jgi:hypothetical protein
MQVFETDIGLFLANRKTGDIFLLSDSLSPARIHQGSEEDRQISLLEHNANDEDIIIVRENLEVQRLNPKGGSLRKVGSLSGTLDGASANPDVDPELEITDDGLVIRTSSLTENDAEVTYLQILDTRTGQSFDGRFDASPAIVRRLGTGEIYFIDYEQKPFRLKPGGTSLSVEEVSGLSEKQNIELRYGRCIAGAGAEVRAAISKLVDDFNAGSDVKCTKYGDTYLVTVLSPTSAGEERIDTLFASDGTSTEVRTRISDAITPEGLPSSNFSWVGMHPETRALAVLLNRDAFVEDDQGLRLHYRHPTVPQSARFIDARHLVVVEAEAGRLVQHDLGDRPSGELYASAASDIIGTEQPVATLHAGTCVGYSNPKSDTAVLPDGRKIRLNVASATSSNDVQEIQVSEAAGPRVLKLDKETTCIQFSADWKHLLSVNATNVSIYDFERALATQSLEKGKVGKIGIAGPSSAFFVGKSGDILTSNVTNRVLLWKGNGETWTSTELYRGESPIVYAEPDADGERILLLEVIGGGTVHGFMYSIKARQKWFDLGTDYKWLGAAFTDKHEVAVSKHNTWTDVFPVLPLSRLVEIAKKELTPSCQPARQGDFKSSPCWPSSIE